MLANIKSQLDSGSTTLDYSYFASRSLYTQGSVIEETPFYRSLHLPNTDYSKITQIILNTEVSEQMIEDVDAITSALPNLNEIALSFSEIYPLVQISGELILSYALAGIKITSDDEEITAALNTVFQKFIASIIKEVQQDPNWKNNCREFNFEQMELYSRQSIDSFSIEQLTQIKELSDLANQINKVIRTGINNFNNQRKSAILAEMNKRQALIVLYANHVDPVLNMDYRSSLLKELVQAILRPSLSRVQELVDKHPNILIDAYSDELTKNSPTERSPGMFATNPQPRDKSLSNILCGCHLFAVHFPVIKYLLENGMPVLSAQELFEHKYGLYYAFDDISDSTHTASRLLLLGLKNSQEVNNFLNNACALDFDAARRADNILLVKNCAQLIDSTYEEINNTNLYAL